MPEAATTCLPRPARALALLGWWLCGLGIWGVASPLYAAPDLAEADQAVETARESMGSPRWYDGETDDFRPINVRSPRPPRQPWNPRLDWNGFFQILAWIVFAVLLGLVAWLIIRAFLDRENNQLATLDELEQKRVKADIARVEELPLILSTPPEDYLNAAHRYYQKGDFGPAILYLFSHQLLQLDRWHWLHLLKGKTNRQYLREVARARGAAASELTAILELTVLLFEEVYFGKRIPPRQAIDQAWSQIDRFESLVPQAAEQAA